MNETKTPQEIGTFIGQAIARDVLANSELARAWDGLEPQDFDQIPEWFTLALVQEVEEYAEKAYLAMVGEK